MQDTPRKKSMYSTVVQLSASELSAVEAWRSANEICSQAEALRELVRFGLLGEIRRVYEQSERNREFIRGDDPG